eukprot:746152-Hanusia_phi.AAC.2
METKLVSSASPPSKTCEQALHFRSCVQQVKSQEALEHLPRAGGCRGDKERHSELPGHSSWEGEGVADVYLVLVLSWYSQNNLGKIWLTKSKAPSVHPFMVSPPINPGRLLGRRMLAGRDRSWTRRSLGKRSQAACSKMSEGSERQTHKSSRPP